MPEAHGHPASLVEKLKDYGQVNASDGSKLYLDQDKRVSFVENQYGRLSEIHYGADGKESEVHLGVLDCRFIKRGEDSWERIDKDGQSKTFEGMVYVSKDGTIGVQEDDKYGDGFAITVQYRPNGDVVELDPRRVENGIIDTRQIRTPGSLGVRKQEDSANAMDMPGRIGGSESYPFTNFEDPSVNVADEVNEE